MLIIQTRFKLCSGMWKKGILLDQFLSMSIGIDRNWSELIGIDRHWSELIDIGINARILIGIDQHWALIEGVLSSNNGLIPNGQQDNSKSFIPGAPARADCSNSWGRCIWALDPPSQTMTYDDGMLACQAEGGVLAILDSLELFNAGLTVVQDNEYVS